MKEQEENKASWEEVSPYVDKALSSLSKRSQNIIVLRCMEGKSNTEAASILGVSETTASDWFRKSLEKLRKKISSFGVTLMPAVIPGLLQQNQVQVPATLVKGFSELTQVGPANASSLFSEAVLETWKGTLKMILWQKVKMAVVAAVAVITAGVGIPIIYSQVTAVKAETVAMKRSNGNTTLLPCPDPKPKFDHAKINRSLKEPKYGSDKPLYRFFAFGPQGKQIMAAVSDESKGTGKGYDTWYLDLNLNRDITEKSERFNLPSPMRGNFQKNGMFVPRYNPPKLFQEKKLPVKDATFDYSFWIWGGQYWQVKLKVKDNSWEFMNSLAGVNWSPDKNTAPVWRYGGDEFSLANENIAKVPPITRHSKQVSIINGTFPVGTNIVLSGNWLHFLGSSPNRGYRDATLKHRGFPELSAWLEVKDKKGGVRIIDCPFRNS
jgi:hypothetical protein